MYSDILESVPDLFEHRSKCFYSFFFIPRGESEREYGVFQLENDSNNEDCAHSPILLDLDKNSKQQQEVLSQEESSPSKLPAVDQYLQDQLIRNRSGIFIGEYVVGKKKR